MDPVLPVLHLKSLLIVVAIGCAVMAAAAVAATGQDGSSATFAPLHTRASAERDAAPLLRSVVLPTGAQKLSREPSADRKVLRSSGPHEFYVDAVERHVWWRVPNSWRSVLAFVRTHAPAGSHEFTSGSGSTSGRETYAFIVFGWPRTAGIRTRQLTVVLATTSGGSTYLRVDAHVVWLLPRPASERIPAGVHTIEVTRGLPGRAPLHSIAVTDAAKIRAIVAVTNRLPIVQPGEFDSCNTSRSVGAVTPEITFTFRAAPGGPVLAVAKEPADATEPGTCEPMALSIAGVRQKALLQGPKLVDDAQQLLRKKI